MASTAARLHLLGQHDHIQIADNPQVAKLKIGASLSLLIAIIKPTCRASFVLHEPEMPHAM